LCILQEGFHIKICSSVLLLQEMLQDLGSSEEAPGLLNSLRYEVINPAPIFGESIFKKFTNHPACVIVVIASVHVILPFTNCHDAGHMSRGKIND